MKTYILLSFSCLFIFSLSSQETPKDTLFFKYDKEYINTYEQIPNHYYLDDSSGGSSGSFFLKKIEVTNNMKPKKILCLKKVVHSSKFYNTKKKRKLDDDGLFEYLGNYTIFLVKENEGANEFIRVRASWEIE